MWRHLDIRRLFDCKCCFRMKGGMLLCWIVGLWMSLVAVVHVVCLFVCCMDIDCAWNERHWLNGIGDDGRMTTNSEMDGDCVLPWMSWSTELKLPLSPSPFPTSVCPLVYPSPLRLVSFVNLFLSPGLSVCGSIWTLCVHVPPGIRPGL